MRLTETIAFLAEGLFLNLGELKLNLQKKTRTLENKQLKSQYFRIHISIESLKI